VLDGDAHTKAQAGGRYPSDPLAGSDDVPGWDEDEGGDAWELTGRG
jgi:hypothetical protein